MLRFLEQLKILKGTFLIFIQKSEEKRIKVYFKIVFKNINSF